MEKTIPVSQNLIQEMKNLGLKVEIREDFWGPTVFVQIPEPRINISDAILENLQEAENIDMEVKNLARAVQCFNQYSRSSNNEVGIRSDARAEEIIHAVKLIRKYGRKEVTNRLMRAIPQLAEFLANIMSFSNTSFTVQKEDIILDVTIGPATAHPWRNPVGKKYSIRAKLAYDLTKPRYKETPPYITDLQLYSAFRAKLEEAKELYNRGQELRTIGEVNIIVFKSKKYTKAAISHYKNARKTLTEAIENFDKEQVLQKLKEIDQRIQRLNREMKELSSKAWKVRREEISRGIAAFYDGKFGTALKLLGTQKFKELMRKEYGIEGYVADASDRWRAFVVLHVYYDGFKLLPNGNVTLAYSDDNGEKGVIQFYDMDLEDGDFKYTIDDAEAGIFYVHKSDLDRAVRQGDVLVIKNWREEPSEPPERDTKLVIRESHVLTSDEEFEYWEYHDKDLGQEIYIVKLKAPAVLEHNSHQSVTLEPGLHYITTARRDLGIWD